MRIQILSDTVWVLLSILTRHFMLAWCAWATLLVIWHCLNLLLGRVLHTVSWCGANSIGKYGATGVVTFVRGSGGRHYLGLCPYTKRAVRHYSTLRSVLACFLPTSLYQASLTLWRMSCTTIVLSLPMLFLSTHTDWWRLFLLRLILLTHLNLGSGELRLHNLRLELLRVRINLERFLLWRSLNCALASVENNIEPTNHSRCVLVIKRSIWILVSLAVLTARLLGVTADV